jgi:hypothetical protein
MAEVFEFSFKIVRLSAENRTPWDIMETVYGTFPG